MLIQHTLPDPARHTTTQPSRFNDVARSTAVTQKKNVTLLSASIEVSVAQGNRELSLLYQSALDSLNELLADDLGPNAIQTTYAAGIDVSQ